MKTKLVYGNYEGYEVPIECEVVGLAYRFKFPNGYGASVIKCDGSYGYEDDLFELGVLTFNEQGECDITYDTKITHDVLGYLTNEQVLETLEQIKNLKGGE